MKRLVIRFAIVDIFNPNNSRRVGRQRLKCPSDWLRICVYYDADSEQNGGQFHDTVYKTGAGAATKI